MASFRPQREAAAVISPATLPSISFLQAIHSQVENSNWEWMPWKRVLSEDAVLEMKSRRAQALSGGQHDLVHALENIAGVFHEEWDLELGASAIRVQSLSRSSSRTFASAHQMASEIRQCRKQKQPTASSWRKYLRYVFSFQGHTLNDALNQVTVDRDLLRNLGRSRL